MDLVNLAFGTLTGLGALGAVTGIALATRAFGNARLLASMPPTPTAALEPGLHEVTGTLLGTNGLEAPLTGRPCTFYRLLLEQRRRNRWETVLDEREALPGVLGDGSGRVRLDLAVADVVVASTERVRTGVMAVPSPELTALLAKVAPPAAPPAGPFLRWREETLSAGDRVCVVGTAWLEDADPTDESTDEGGGSVGEGPSGAWTIGATADAPFLVSDRDGAEVIRHQRRAGRRWVAVGILSLAVVAWGALRFAPPLAS